MFCLIWQIYFLASSFKELHSTLVSRWVTQGSFFSLQRHVGVSFGLCSWRLLLEVQIIIMCACFEVLMIIDHKVTFNVGGGLICLRIFIVEKMTICGNEDLNMQYVYKYLENTKNIENNTQFCVRICLKIEYYETVCP